MKGHEELGRAAKRTWSFASSVFRCMIGVALSFGVVKVRYHLAYQQSFQLQMVT